MPADSSIGNEECVDRRVDRARLSHPNLSVSWRRERATLASLMTRVLEVCVGPQEHSPLVDGRSHPDVATLTNRQPPSTSRLSWGARCT